jgi:hypothetical protein
MPQILIFIPAYTSHYIYCILELVWEKVLCFQSSSEDSSSLDEDGVSDENNDTEMENSEDEFWTDVPEEILDQDITSPLTNPQRKKEQVALYQFLVAMVVILLAYLAKYLSYKQ